MTHHQQFNNTFVTSVITHLYAIGLIKRFPAQILFNDEHSVDLVAGTETSYISCLYLQSMCRTYELRGRKYPPSQREINFVTNRWV